MKVSEQDVIRHLRAAIEESGSQSRFAAKHGFSKQYVSLVLSGDRTPSERLLAVLGIRRVLEVSYER